MNIVMVCEVLVYILLSFIGSEMDKRIAIIGAGGLGREVAMLIEAINKASSEIVWRIIGFYDDDKSLLPGTHIRGYPILGTVDDINSVTEPIALSIAVGSVVAIKNIHSRISNAHTYYPNLIHPSALVDHTTVLGDGNIIAYGCYISCDIKLGSFNVFNVKCTIGHDAKIGSYNVFSPNIIVSGCVQIGDANFWGLNAAIIQQKSVGSRNKIGASSLLVRSIKDDGFYFGTPALKKEL